MSQPKDIYTILGTFKGYIEMSLQAKGALLAHQIEKDAIQEATKAIQEYIQKQETQSVIEEVEEIYTMAKTNYEHTGNPNMKTLGKYCQNRIAQLKEELNNG